MIVILLYVIPVKRYMDVYLTRACKAERSDWENTSSGRHEQEADIELVDYYYCVARLVSVDMV